MSTGYVTILMQSLYERQAPPFLKGIQSKEETEMKKIACLVLGGTLVLFTGCATISGMPENQGVTPESGSDGIIKQRVEFKDLSAWEQEVILQGGGGE